MFLNLYFKYTFTVYNGIPLINIFTVYNAIVREHGSLNSVINFEF